MLECVHEGQERNPGLLGFLQGWGKLFAGSCHGDEALRSICVLPGLLLPWAPAVFSVAMRRAKPRRARFSATWEASEELR